MKKLFSFNLPAIIGLILGVLLFNQQSESNPLSQILMSPFLYLSALLIAVILQFIYWTLIDTGTVENLKPHIINAVIDYIIIVLVIMSIIGTLFIIDTFWYPLQ